MMTKSDSSVVQLFLLLRLYQRIWQKNSMEGSHHRIWSSENKKWEIKIPFNFPKQVQQQSVSSFSCCNNETCPSTFGLNLFFPSSSSHRCRVCQLSFESSLTPTHSSAIPIIVSSSQRLSDTCVTCQIKYNSWSRSFRFSSSQAHSKYLTQTKQKWIRSEIF